MRSFRVLAVAVLAVLVVAPMFQPVAAYVGTLDQQQTTVNNGVILTAGQALGQTFTAGLTGGLTEVDLAIGCRNSSGGTCDVDPTVTVGIHSGTPTGALLGSTSLPGSAFPNIYPSTYPSGFTVTFTFSSPPPVVAGNVYALAMTIPYDATYVYYVGYDGNLYSYGTRWHTTSPGPPNWVQDPSLDLAFKTYVAPPAVLSDLAGFTESDTGDVLMVIGDLALNPHGSKPSGVNYQQGRDTTPLGYLRGMVNNTQPSMFDTNVAVNVTSGRPLSSVPQTLIFSIGGPGINAVTYYYENTSNTTDMAPVKLGYNSTHYWWALTSNGTKVYTGLQSETAVPPGTSDVFVIQILRDADGRLVVLMYGTRYTGTWAAAEYFKSVVYPTIASWTDSYYIVQWTDATSGTSANFMPDSGDTFTVLAHGIP